MVYFMYTKFMPDTTCLYKLYEMQNSNSCENSSNKLLFDGPHCNRCTGKGRDMAVAARLSLQEDTDVL